MVTTEGGFHHLTVQVATAFGLPDARIVVVEHPFGGIEEDAVLRRAQTIVEDGVAAVDAPDMPVVVDLSGKAALVTGAGAGIGAEIARWLARAGASVAVADVRGEEAEQVAASIRSDGGRAVTIVANCRDDPQIERMVQATVDGLGGLDIAVNNIGMTAGRGGRRIVDMDGDYWRDLIDQNLVLTALCGRAEARVMVAQGKGGVILNVSSGETTRPVAVPRRLRRRQGGHQPPDADDGRRARTGPYPGGRHRPRHDPDGDSSRRLRRRSRRRHNRIQPLRRMTDPDELGRLAVFLASDLARCITGQLILADAGAHLSRTRPANITVD